MVRIRKIAVLLCVLAVAGLAVGCGGSSSAPQEQPAATAAVTQPPSVPIGNLLLDEESSVADLASAGCDMEEAIRILVENRRLLPSLKEIRLGDAAVPFDMYSDLRRSFPSAEISWECRLFGEPLDKGVRRLDMSSMQPEQTEELCAVLPYLSELEEIDFVSEDGVCVYSLDDIPLLDLVRKTVPNVYLKVRFELFGQTVTSEDERIEYYLTHIGNEGVDTVRAVLPYLRSCTYFLMDGCDVDNEVMAQLREDFPVPKIVWRVWLIKPWYSSQKMMRRGSFLTDTERVRTTLIRPENCDVLKYCTETKYVDFGHNFFMSDYSFLACMPKLEACIIAISHVSDLTPLASCPELEYLEVFTTDITTVAPLANCKKLAYLNIANCKKLTDITALYDMTSLKVLRMVVTPNVPKEQKEELARRLPNCQILNVGGDPTENGWRYDQSGGAVPRYILLREQMQYDEDRRYGIP